MKTQRGTLKHDGGYRVLVYGGRDYPDGELVRRTLDRIHRVRGILCIVTGMAGEIDEDTRRVICGADLFAWEWAKDRGIPVAEYEVTRGQWKYYGKSAGPIRNQRLFREGLPDVAVGFGEADCEMESLCLERGVPLWKPESAAFVGR